MPFGLACKSTLKRLSTVGCAFRPCPASGLQLHFAALGTTRNLQHEVGKSIVAKSCIGKLGF